MFYAADNKFSVNSVKSLKYIFLTGAKELPYYNEQTPICRLNYSILGEYLIILFPFTSKSVTLESGIPVKTITHGIPLFFGFIKDPFSTKYK